MFILHINYTQPFGLLGSIIPIKLYEAISWKMRESGRYKRQLNEELVILAKSAVDEMKGYNL